MRDLQNGHPSYLSKFLLTITGSIEPQVRIGSSCNTLSLLWILSSNIQIIYCWGITLSLPSCMRLRNDKVMDGVGYIPSLSLKSCRYIDQR
ncbi:hypothetical protein NPIL_257471 [Nephila pilipes]|uniref:Uncharacterized protein n=1 Tax=Nephila pilipes TaxID=299642 RepID=A0A8X6MIE6_NEPPI|nr:hypothetical protein NPIL_257471 [Nephila pilipes]